MMDYQHLGEIEEINPASVVLDNGRTVPRADLNNGLEKGKDLYGRRESTGFIYVVIPKCSFCDIRPMKGDEEFICPSCNNFRVEVDEPNIHDEMRFTPEDVRESIENMTETFGTK